MSRSLARAAAAGALALLLAACATPASRIRQNPELFASFPLDVQSRVSQGQVDLGFNADMVTMALGKPDREYRRKTDQGDVLVWSYVDYYISTARQSVPASYRVIDAAGRYRTVMDTTWVDVQQRNEYEKLRVEFRDGKVTAVETLKK